MAAKGPAGTARLTVESISSDASSLTTGVSDLTATVIAMDLITALQKEVDFFVDLHFTDKSYIEQVSK